jgi:LacI family transcriptional regulator
MDEVPMSDAKFHRIYADLKQKITAGQLLAGERLPAEKELANQYGVALLTMRQALRLLREEGLITSRRYHGTVVADGGGMDAEFKGRIGMVIPYGMSTLCHPVFSRLVDGVAGVLVERGYQLDFAVSNPHNGLSEKALKRSIESMDVVGWIIPTLISDEAKGWIRDNDKPRVSLHEVDDNFCPHLFLVDLAQLSAQLLDHLYQEGYRKIWTLHPPSMKALGEYMESASHDQSRYPDLRVRNVVSTDFSVLAGKTASMEVLMEEGADAFVCADDDLAMGAYQAIEELGMGIPQIGVVGGGDFPMGERVQPSLTTITYPYYQIGRESAGLLLDLIDGKPVEPAHRYFLPRLLVRHSTKRTDVVDAPYYHSQGLDKLC